MEGEGGVICCSRKPEDESLPDENFIDYRREQDERFEAVRALATQRRRMDFKKGEIEI